MITAALWLNRGWEMVEEKGGCSDGSLGFWTKSTEREAFLPWNGKPCPSVLTLEWVMMNSRAEWCSSRGDDVKVNQEWKARSGGEGRSDMGQLGRMGRRSGRTMGPSMSAADRMMTCSR